MAVDVKFARLSIALSHPHSLFPTAGLGVDEISHRGRRVLTLRGFPGLETIAGPQSLAPCTG